MSSRARKELQRQLEDIGELTLAHEKLTGKKRGRRWKGGAIVRAGVVLLSAATEAFVGDLFNEAVELIFNQLSNDQRKEFYRHTNKRFRAARPFDINMLYFNLGLPFVLNDIRWQKCSNKVLCQKLEKLVETRNKIAHGTSVSVQLASLRSWKIMVEQLSLKLEEKVVKHIEETAGKRPSWD